jgi:hypothetical protein
MLAILEATEARRESVVAVTQQTIGQTIGQTTGQTEDGLPVHSFRTLLADLATVARNTMTTAIADHRDRPALPNHRPDPAYPDQEEGIRPAGGQI